MHIKEGLQFKYDQKVVEIVKHLIKSFWITTSFCKDFDIQLAHSKPQSATGKMWVLNKFDSRWYYIIFSVSNDIILMFSSVKVNL